jgi:hypothetical protein
MRFKKLCLFGIVILSSSVFAEPMPVFVPHVLDNIQFQLTARDWVFTDSALLKIHISATLTNTDIVKAHQHILEQLNKIAKGDWQIIQFNRGQDSSGLEKLEVDAQIRVAQNILTNVYQQVKTVSHPGENYSVSIVEFKPSFEEMQQAKNHLREKLYKQVVQELESINKLYPSQQYSVHHLEFIEDAQLMIPKAQVENMVLSSMPNQAPMKTSNELYLTVVVDVAANRSEK